MLISILIIIKILVVMKVILINWVVKVKLGIKDRFMAYFKFAVKGKNNAMLSFDDLLLCE